MHTNQMIPTNMSHTDSLLSDPFGIVIPPNAAAAIIAIRLNAQRFEKSLASDSHSSFWALNQQTKPITNGPIKKKSSIKNPFLETYYRNINIIEQYTIH
ncbi:hypothetical protein JKA10_20880 [Vibrio parahaemolyticus]|uniref:hypothetical protein n=1 Tax=Vibrionaceae TaxID=641 RepID=UPI00102A56C5|nr:hypothetical protein [Vibrio parahaemolyticus]MBO1659320.1 hypothetical protein [Vibrio parahaemolyticus]MBY8081917.1 hypothetical protein [Vibrio fluvialis]